jgi:cobalt-zinc-cadmium resistance protein CzcA
MVSREISTRSSTLPLKSVSGQIVPLGDVAELRFVKGPVQVSRDKQSRRLTVEFNVRGRDLVSVVNEAQAAVGRSVTLPKGYRLEWGGQFQHFAEARSRLLVVVPLALSLILFLLWLAFGKVRPAALIFLNIPFAIIGGVVALWVRSIPFSISAGVGFIALFGVAVLNGLVLISFARQLEEQGTWPSRGHPTSRGASPPPRPHDRPRGVAGLHPHGVLQEPGSEVQRPSPPSSSVGSSPPRC